MEFAQRACSSVAKRRAYIVLTDLLAWVRDAAKTKSKNKDSLTALIPDAAAQGQQEVDSGGLTGELSEM